MSAILNESIASSSLADDQMEHATVLLNGHHHHGLQNHLPQRFEYNFWNVNYTVEKKNSAPLKILNSACGTLTSGRLTAILGPSGAGKTSMLNVLSAFKASGVTGEFTINGKERRMLQYRKMSSYIPQDFAMLELLTVQETLNVSAHLKLPKDTTKQDRCKIIEDIIQMLNMDKCRHTLVRNISGGEQKRLSIGIELVTNPPIMFFDEPTSGLDSVASLQVIKYLRQLALDGRIIVCVVHQPSSNLMKLFDDIIVMSRGEVLYAGSQQKMVPCFENAGFICPSFYNPADFVLEVGSEAHNERSFDLIQKNKEQLFKSRHDNDASENTPLLEYSALDVTISVNGTQTANGDVASTLTQPQHHRCEAALVRPKAQVGFNTQLYVLMGRSLRSLSRNMISVQLRLLMHIIVGILLGIVFWQIGNDAAKALSNASCLFFVVMFVFFGNAMPSILLCPQDTAVFIREYLNGWYSIKAYYIAKVLADIPMQFACPTVFITIVYLMTGQPEDIGRFVMCWGICLLTAFIGHFIGLVFGSTFNLQMSVFLVPGITIPFMIFSGFFIRIHEVPKFLSFLCDASFFRYTMEGFMQAIYGFNRPDLDCFIDFCYFKSPVKFLKEFDMYGEQYGLDVVALLVWIFALKILFFLSLCYRIKRAV